MKDIKVLALTGAPESACSFYRCLGPLMHLAQNRRAQEPQIRVVGGNPDLKWTTLLDCDVVFMQRAEAPRHVEAIKRARGCGKKVIMDWDDNVFEIERRHPEFEYFSSEILREAVIRSAALVDEVWVSTEELAQVFRNFSPRVRVIQNAVDDFLFPDPTAAAPGDIRSAVWRGGHTHGPDLEAFLPEFDHLHNERGLSFTFLGMKPDPLSRILRDGRWSWVEMKPTDLYLRMLKRINAKLHMVPLVDSPFNRAKSDISYLEAVWIGGSAVVGPQFWGHLPGVLTDWASAADLSEEERVIAVRDAQLYISGARRLSIINEIRRAAIANLVHPGLFPEPESLKGTTRERDELAA